MDGRGDSRFIIAGAIAAIALPGAVFLAGIPYYAALPMAAVLFGGIAFLLAPRRPLEGVDIDLLGRGNVAAARAALTQAEGDLQAIDQARRRIRRSEITTVLARLTTDARSLLRQIEAEPAKLSDVRRLIAVYLPRTREIAESFGELESGGRLDDARAQRVEAVLTRIDGTLRHFGERMVEAEAKELDIELKLVEDSIRQEGSRQP